MTFEPPASEPFLVALGGNGSPDWPKTAEVLISARERLIALGLQVIASSRIYRCAAYPAGSGPDFANAAIKIKTDRTPEALMDLLHEVEVEFHRRRDKRWGQRSLDLDLLAQGATVLPSSEVLSFWINLPLEEQLRATPTQLLLPHPRLHERGFVLAPLADIAPDWVHPVLGQSVREMLTALGPLPKTAVISLAKFPD